MRKAYGFRSGKHWSIQCRWHFTYEIARLFLATPRTTLAAPNRLASRTSALRTDESLQILSFRLICAARTRISYGELLVPRESEKFQANSLQRQSHGRMGAKDFNLVQKQSQLVLGHRRQVINEVKITSFLHDKCKKSRQIEIVPKFNQSYARVE